MTGGDDASAGACHDIDTGKKLWSIPRLARMLAFTSDGSILFATERNTYTSVLVLDAKTGKPMDGVKMPEQIHDLGIPPLPSPDGHTVLLGDIKIRGFILWDYKAGKELGVIPAYSSSGDYRNRAAAFSRDGKTLFTTIDRLRRLGCRDRQAFRPARPRRRARRSGRGRSLFRGRPRGVFARNRPAVGAMVVAGKPLEGGKAKADSTRFPGDAAVFKAEHAVLVFHRFPTAGSVPEKVEDNKPFNRFPVLPPLTVPTADGRRMLALSDISIGDKRRLSLRRWTAGAGELAGVYSADSAFVHCVENKWHGTWFGICLRAACRVASTAIAATSDSLPFAAMESGPGAIEAADAAPGPLPDRRPRGNGRWALSPKGGESPLRRRRNSHRNVLGASGSALRILVIVSTSVFPAKGGLPVSRA